MDLHILKQEFLTALVKWCNENENTYNFQITIDEGKDDGFGFYVKGFVYHYYDESGIFTIGDIGITEFQIQFIDYYCNLERKFINEIIEFCKE